MTVLPAKTIEISINRHWKDVYEFASDPRNIHLWASGLTNQLEPTENPLHWLGDGGPIGKIEIQFCEPNSFGVIDHTVTMPNGITVHNALRVAPNGTGAEVIFLLLKLDGMSDTDFDKDAEHVLQDLQNLRSLLEAE